MNNKQLVIIHISAYAVLLMFTAYSLCGTLNVYIAGLQNRQ